MTTNRFLVDATVFIDSARGREPAPSWLERAEDARIALLVSAVTLAEYASGVDPGKPDQGIAYLSTLTVLPVTPPIAIQAGGLRYAFARRGRSLSLADALIAATALDHGLPLVTSNVRDFRAIDGLAIVEPVIDGSV